MDEDREALDHESPRHYYRHNRLKQLRAFCHAAQERSISRAAERLELSQPSVSLQIQALEREMGITLFERRGPRIRLTPDGEGLYEVAAPLVEGIDSLPEQFVARNRRQQLGHLDIAAGESTSLYVLPDLLRAFMEHHPKVHVRLHNLIGEEQIHAVQQDRVDIAVGSNLDLPDDVVYRATHTFELKLITPLNHPLAEKEEITLEDLAAGELILPPRQLTTWRLVNLIFQQHSVPYQVRLEVGGWEIMKRYVELGFGVGIASAICLTGQEQLAIRDLPAIFPRRTYGVMLRRGRYLSPQARRFLELIDPEGFGEAAEWDGVPGSQESVLVPGRGPE
ncbi:MULTISPECIES: LysR family transcriptional regulator [Halorhodospira]|uniref:LysR family transcriptional regulator n=1 Tax=Halorhodospira TaxID=85108 RepID=UPI0019126672|nr:MULTISPECIES: LysR family transcriptional regulator [Halorhodospira]MBK5943722.1 LysR family transcriptional regulator [Halorhodospira halophila]MCG5540530.1 LysR family transcriptional regulator [Halorhodospira sp. M39old]MCG5544974.1 LysR family transcriptional regulator [Halorhodospira sp. M38]